MGSSSSELSETTKTLLPPQWPWLAYPLSRTHNGCWLLSSSTAAACSWGLSFFFRSSTCFLGVAVSWCASLLVCECGEEEENFPNELIPYHHRSLVFVSSVLCMPNEADNIISLNTNLLLQLLLLPSLSHTVGLGLDPWRWVGVWYGVQSADLITITCW